MINPKLTPTILFLLLFASLNQSVAFARTPPPELVNNSFKNLFPDAKKINWYNIGGLFLATFTKEKIPFKVTFDSAGSLLKSEKKILKKELPFKVKQFLETQYEGYKFIDGLKIEYLKKDPIYQLSISHDKSKMELTVSNDGYLTSK